jgi:hypothetical protein
MTADVVAAIDTRRRELVDVLAALEGSEVLSRAACRDEQG